MTAQGSALGNKSATMTNALKGRNKMFNPTNGGKSFSLSGLARFVSYDSQGDALGLHVTAPLGQIVRSSSGSSPAGCVTDPGVNRRGKFDLFFSVMCCLGLFSGGCAIAPAARPARYWIAARYDVEPKLSEGGLSGNNGVISNDFKAIAGLGFSSVVLNHVEDGDRRRLLELADEVGLKAAIPDRRFDRFVVTGGLPPQCRDENPGAPGLREARHVAEGIRSSPNCSRAVRLTDIVRHSAFHGYVVEGGRGSAARERSRKLCAQLVRNGTPCISLGDNDDTPLAIIDARAVREGPPGTALERLLAKYHAALCAGQTGGVIVDRFMRLPGDPPGLTSPDEPLLPAHSSAIAALIQRARCWGPRLSALSASSLISATDSSWLTVTAFGRGARRYVLVFNTSEERFAREEVRLPALILDQAVLRAVEVPPSTDLGAGRVIHAQRGQLILSIELRPGDAALFEVFSTGSAR